MRKFILPILILMICVTGARAESVKERLRKARLAEEAEKAGIKSHAGDTSVPQRQNQVDAAVRTAKSEGTETSSNSLDGTAKEYYPGGALRSEITYQNGRKLSMKEYSRSGSVASEARFRSDNDFDMVQYDETGRKVAEIKMRNGRATEYLAYDENGAVVDLLKAQQEEMQEMQKIFEGIDQKPSSTFSSDRPTEIKESDIKESAPVQQQFWGIDGRRN